jgi:7-carboxy-7-deazaguanine synthase
MLSEKAKQETAEERVRPLKVLSSSSQPSSSSLLVHEIYTSIQGESSFAGVPCSFVRLTGCHLRCSWCDTEHAFHHGDVRSIEDVVKAVEGFGVPVVEVTGGEPLLQPATPALLTALCDAGLTVLVETSGAVSIAGLDPRARLIVDVKLPGSGEWQRNRWSNLPLLRPGLDELKLVISDDEDLAAAVEVVAARPIPRGVTVLFSPAFPGMPAQRLAEVIIERRLPVRFQLQLHKVLWGERPGV